MSKTILLKSASTAGDDSAMALIAGNRWDQFSARIDAYLHGHSQRSIDDAFLSVTEGPKGVEYTPLGLLLHSWIAISEARTITGYDLQSAHLPAFGERILARGAAIDAWVNGAETMLIKAIRNRQWDAAQWALAHGAKPNVTAANGQAALHLLMDSFGSSEWQSALTCLRELLAHGANAGQFDGKQQTPLLMLLQRLDGGPLDADDWLWQKQALDLLLQHIASAELTAMSGKVLLCAAEHFRPEAVVQLLQAGLDVNARDHRGRTALMMTHSKLVAQALLAAQADLEARDWLGKTPLLWAVESDRLGVCALLLAAGADANAASFVKPQYTALRLGLDSSDTELRTLFQSFAARAAAQRALVETKSPGASP